MWYYCKKATLLIMHLKQNISDAERVHKGLYNTISLLLLNVILTCLHFCHSDQGCSVIIFPKLIMYNSRQLLQETRKHSVFCPWRSREPHVNWKRKDWYKSTTSCCKINLPESMIQRHRIVMPKFCFQNKTHSRLKKNRWIQLVKAATVVRKLARGLVKNYTITENLV